MSSINLPKRCSVTNGCLTVLSIWSTLPDMCIALSYEVVTNTLCPRCLTWTTSVSVQRQR